MRLKCPKRLKGVVCYNCLELYWSPKEVDFSQVSRCVQCVLRVWCDCAMGGGINECVEACDLYLVM